MNGDANMLATCFKMLEISNMEIQCLFLRGMETWTAKLWVDKQDM